ncbi:MAG TPA: hypothetical protein DIT04_10485 [Dysgonomonas sp.]|nr:hypothetical protein [Dysgonomonas sp.]
MHDKYLNKTLIISVISLIIFIGVQILNFFRQELFGVVPGYAPHNFSFNLLIYIPANIISLVLSIVVIKKIYPDFRIKKNLLAILIISPIILLWIYTMYIIFVF